MSGGVPQEDRLRQRAQPRRLRSRPRARRVRVNELHSVPYRSL